VARQPVPSPRGGGRRRRRGKVRHLSLQHEERSSSRSVPVHRRIAEVGRTPSGSEKRATFGGRVESLVAIPERVNGSLTIGGAQARKRRRPPAAKGGRFIEARRSSSRERRVPVKAAQFRSCFGTSGMCARVCRWKAPWIGNAHAFHEAPAEPILAAFEPQRGTRLAAAHAKSEKEATGVSEANGIEPRAREENAPAGESTGR